MKKNKWLNGALPAILIHISIGSVYAWSLFVNPISELLNKSTSAVQFAFSLAIFFLGMSAAFGGKFVEKNIHKASLLSTIFFTSGLLISALAIHFKSLLLLYLGYGVCMGIGLGIGYITPVKTLMLWFTNNKGLATGIAVCAFGFASSIASFIISYLLSHTTIQMTFVTLAIIYLFPMIIARFLLEKPSWWREDIQSNEPFSYINVLKNSTFIKIWFVVFLNIACGLALISIASPLMVEIGTSPKVITTVISIMGIFNGLGRIVISTLSDKLPKRFHIYLCIACVSMVLMILGNIPFLSERHTVHYISLCLISAGYGAGFSCLPSLLSDLFGMKNISKIHGLSLTAWAIAGLVGNQFSSMIKHQHGSYLYVIPWLITFYAIELVVASLIGNKKEEL